MRNGVIHITLCLCFLAAPGLSHIKSTPEEYELKAAYLYNFAKFITWPDSAFSPSDNFFIIAVLGQSRITEYLNPLQTKTVRGRQVVIKTFPSIENISQCHILFLSSETVKKQAYILGRLSTKAIITVSDQENFVDNGGIIQLVTARDRLRFMINKARADQLNLKIGSRLLALATDVKVDSHE